MILQTLALTMFQASLAPGGDFAPIEVRCADGGSVARIDRAPGQELVAANLARYSLTVFALDSSNQRRELWSSAYPYDSSPARYVLANRGRAFVEIEEHFSESHTVVQIHANGRDGMKWSGAELAVPPESLGGTNPNRTWLDESRAASIGWADGAFGPCLELDIPCRGGLARKIDLDRLRLLESDRSPIAARVEPAIQGALPARNAVPYVNSVEYPHVARAGRGLEFKISGNHATPGWKFLGFELELTEDMLSLTPRSEPPDGIVAQVLTEFRATAQLIDLPVGKYLPSVSGWLPRGTPHPIEVLPERLLASLHTRGGFAGIDQRIELHAQGLLRRVFRRDTAANFLELSDPRLQRLQQLLAALPARNRLAGTPGAADLFEHQLGFFSGENWIVIEVDDLAATEVERELIAALRAD